MNELALFTGAGGGILGGHLLGWRTVCAVEIEPYPTSVLAQRQNDGILPPFPVWDDIRTFDGRPWRGRVDVVSGGFPCQDISAAGKGAGIDGEKSGLWSEMARVISEVRPRYAFMENSPLLVGRGLIEVIRDLAEIGYDAIWNPLGANDVGAPHVRERLWILAKDSNAARKRWVPSTNAVKSQVFTRKQVWSASEFATLLAIGQSQYPVISEDERMGDGLAAGMDEFKAIGNGQVPLVAATAWLELIGRIEI